MNSAGMTVDFFTFFTVISIFALVFLVMLFLIVLLYMQTDARKKITWQLVMEQDNRNKDRDPLRWFQPETLAHVHTRAGNQCEWFSTKQGRCKDRSEEVDHIYPWWEGGWTIESNAQALCKRHNQMKGSSVPTDALLEAATKRRGEYCTPEEAAIRWKPSNEERRSRELWIRNGNKGFTPEMPSKFDGKRRRPKKDLLEELKKSS